MLFNILEILELLLSGCNFRFSAQAQQFVWLVLLYGFGISRLISPLNYFLGDHFNTLLVIFSNAIGVICPILFSQEAA